MVMGIKLDSNVGSIHREYQSQELNFMGKKTGSPYVLCRHLQWNHTHPDVKESSCNLSDRTGNMRKSRNGKRESAGFGDLLDTGGGGMKEKKTGRCQHQCSSPSSVDSMENMTKPNK